MSLYLTGTIDKGKFSWDYPIEEITANMRDGKYLFKVDALNPQSDIATYRALYFVKVDFICKEQGEKRYDMHEIIKEEIIAPMMHELPYLFNATAEITTRNLTLEGWPQLIERLDLWAFVTFNIILP